MGAFMSRVLVPWEHERTRLPLKVVMQTTGRADGKAGDGVSGADRYD